MGRFSFVHLDDAAAATVAALALDGPRVLDVVDDDPAPLREWLPHAAAVLGARPPRRVAAWVARVAVGPHAVHLAEQQRGAANARAGRELGWAPARPSWREGFGAALVAR